MRTLFATILILVFASAALAQGGHDGPVVPKAASLEWDDPNPAGIVQLSRMYCGRTAGVTQDPLLMVAEIQAPALVWAITLDPGQWYCAVSFSDGTVESELSGEVAFYILDPPSNIRIVR